MTDTKNNNKMLIIEKMADILMDEANAEIEQLRKERDEARREVCNLTKWDHYGPRHYAQYRGWDCFKEDSNG